MIVAVQFVNVVRNVFSPNSPMVISPPPPTPVRHLIALRKKIVLAAAQPRHPNIKVTVDTKKQVLRPNMSENRPYNGWKAVLVIRYEVVSHEALLAARKSELINAYVEAVIVPSNPDRNTFAQSAVIIRKIRS